MFLDHARNILSLMDQAVEKTQLTERGHIGRLDIGIFGSAIFELFPSVVPPFRASFPNINVVLHDLNKSEQIKALRDRRLSVGFSRFVWDEPDLSKELVSTARLHAACPSAHPLATRDIIKVKDLMRQPLILYPRVPRPSFVDKVIGLCRDEGFEPSIEQEVDDVITAVALVIFARWNPMLCFLASLLFGGAAALGPALQSVQITWGYHLFGAAPYFLTLAIMIATCSPKRTLVGAPAELSITK